MSVLLLAAIGCSNWPLHGNLPQENGRLLPVGEDPRALYDLAWVSVDEMVDSDTTIGLAHHEVDQQTARHYSGRLAGTGWWDDADSVVLDAGCGSSWARSPLQDGDYLGDVDYFIVDLTEAGTLCGRLTVDAPDYGWDLLLHPLDLCDVPSERVVDAQGGILGLGLGGPIGEWSVPVQPGAYAVLLAGYYPNDDEAQLNYDLGLALIATPDGEGVSPCPLLPTEGAP